jgi:hypothetical protein
MSWAFGTATNGDIDAMKQAIAQIMDVARTSAAEATRTKDGMATFSRLQNQRLDKLHAVLETEHKSMQSLYTEVREIHDTTAIEFNAVGVIATELAQFIQTHDHISELLAGIEDLTRGHLSPKLIDPDQLRAIIANVSRNLQIYRLIHSVPGDIYAGRNFEFARSGQDLFIRLRLPYSRFYRFGVYKSITVPMPVPGKQGLITELRDFPAYLLISFQHKLVGTLMEPPSSSVLDMSQVTWHTLGDSTCIFDVIFVDNHSTHRLCNFVVRRDVITPSFVKLSTDFYVLTNISSAHVNCGRALSMTTLHTCNPCLLQLACGCSLRRSRSLLIKAPDCISDNQTDSSGFLHSSSFLHAVNLPLLKSFYNMTNHTIAGDTLFSPLQLQPLDDLHLPLFGDEVSRLLAADKTVGYSLNKMADSLQNESVVLHSNAEAMLLEYLRRPKVSRSFWTFDFDSWLPWVVCTSYLLLFFALFHLYQLRQKVLALLIAGHAIPLSKAYQLSPGFLPTTTNSEHIVSDNFFFQLLVDIRHFDFAMLGLHFLFACIFMITSICLYKRLASRRSFLYVELLTASDSYFLRILKLPDGNRFYSVSFSRSRIHLVLTDYLFFGVLTWNRRALSVEDNLRHLPVPLPRFRLLPFWQARRIKHLVAQHCQVTLFVVHTHSLERLSPPDLPPQSDLAVCTVGL